jgi:hypothetical protein
MRVKLKHLLIFVLGILVCVGIYLALPPKLSYGMDCGKPLTGYKVLFVYLRGCPHCYAELVRLHELNLLNMTYQIDADDARCKPVIEEYADYIIYHQNSNMPRLPAGIYVPTKVCLHNNLTYIGEMPKEELKDFFARCE